MVMQAALRSFLPLRQRSSMPFLLHAGLSSRRNLALCLSGQLRGRNSVADLQWASWWHNPHGGIFWGNLQFQTLRLRRCTATVKVQRFGSFDIFAVVPFEAWPILEAGFSRWTWRSFQNHGSKIAPLDQLFPGNPGGQLFP